MLSNSGSRLSPRVAAGIWSSTGAIWSTSACVLAEAMR